MRQDYVPLIKSAQNGDNEAMLLLYLKFERKIFYLSEPHRGIISEDCYQELSIEFMHLVKKFNLDSHLQK
ncbi:helix-turn-helix domain-containing protein [Listeria monocytogenes]|uniref:helix-turn-helix domain-containing protein n=1 Tax=Listeria innocua TaxID=1642 RepID=UPI00127F323B|nr:helix-turn-helix domain-containing protein [Listeria innocua]EAG1721300.1 helix-turn-helix domain-containing protein [Listeria monocytogenes]MBC1384364.1 helix-turn-helix domain-containing protein [Listeria innocua]